MGKWCLHASSFIFDQIIIKVAGNQDRHKSSDEFDLGPLVSMAHLYVFEMRFDLGTLDSGERSLPFGLLVLQSLQWILFRCGVTIEPCLKFYAVPSQSQCMTLRSRSQTLNFFVLNLYSVSCCKAFD